MISFVNFSRIASICVGFDLGTLHGYFFHQDFWPNLNFLLEYQIKLLLNVQLSFQMALLHSLTLMLAFIKGVILVQCYLTFLLMTFFIFSMITAQDVSLSLLENTN